MKRLLISASMVAAFACLGAARASAQATTTIDFNDGASNSAIGIFYQALGVTFSNAIWDDVSAVNESDVGSSGLKLAAAGSSPLMPSALNPIIAIFSQAVSAASIAALDLGGNGVRINAFDGVIGGNLVATTEVLGSGGGEGVNKVLSITGFGIRRLEFFQPLHTEQDGVAFDNLSFTTQAITTTPEPASLALCATGLLGLGAWTRRRRANHVDAT
jgi:hypothetical protein